MSTAGGAGEAHNATAATDGEEERKLRKARAAVVYFRRELNQARNSLERIAGVIATLAERGERRLAKLRGRVERLEEQLEEATVKLAQMEGAD